MRTEVREIEKEVVVKQTVKEIVLFLSVEEAQLLRDILGNIAGWSKKREITDEMYRQLCQRVGSDSKHVFDVVPSFLKD